MELTMSRHSSPFSNEPPSRDPRSDAFDPVELAERAIAANLDSAIFQKIDDRHIKRAPNFFEFCVGADFLAMNPGPFARQIQMATMFFGEWCPRCSQPGFMINGIHVNTTIMEIREKIVFLQYGECPKCHVGQTELYGKNELNAYEEFIMCAGQRSGKSALTGMLFIYHLHRILMLANPSRFYGLMTSSTLHMTLIALTAGQIQDNIWDPFIVGLIDNSPWFRMYHSFLDDIAKRKGLKPVYNLKETFISYDHKGIVLSYSGADFRKLRGKTRIATAIDELGWFDAHAEGAGVKTSGKGQHDALANSLRTIRSAAVDLRAQGKNWVPTGIDCNISSPSSANDMIMRLVRSNSTKTSAWHLPTWDINPKISYDSIRHLELEDKRSFDRDFRAEPPMADSAFMDDEKVVARAANKELHNLVGWNLKRAMDANDPLLETMWLEALPRMHDRNTPRILGIDPGESNNSFALVLASWRHDTQTVKIDGVLECQPEKRDDGSVSRVNFPMMFDKCIVPILEKFNVKMVVTDHWQSSDMVQRLRTYRGTKAEAYTLRYEDMLAIKTAWYDGRIHMPVPEKNIEEMKRSSQQPEDFTRGMPVLKLMYQGMTVREVGRRIIKPLDGTDDIFRAACLTARFLLDPETNRAFIYSGAGKSVSEGRGLGVVRSNKSQPRALIQQTAASRAHGVRKGRGDPTGIVSPHRRPI